MTHRVHTSTRVRICDEVDADSPEDAARQVKWSLDLAGFPNRLTDNETDMSVQAGTGSMVENLRDSHMPAKDHDFVFTR